MRQCGVFPKSHNGDYRFVILESRTLPRLVYRKLKYRSIERVGEPSSSRGLWYFERLRKLTTTPLAMGEVHNSRREVSIQDNPPFDFGLGNLRRLDVSVTKPLPC